MKKLKKVFLVCLFSFLFLGFTDVYATNYVVSNDNDSIYSNFFSSNPQFTREKLDNLCSSLVSSSMSSSYKYYTCSFVISGSSSGWWSYGGTNYTPSIVINQFKSDITLQYYISSSGFGIEYSDLYKSRKFWLNNSVGVKQTDSLSSYLNSNLVSITSGNVSTNSPMFTIIKSTLTNQYFTYNTSSGYTHNLSYNGLNMGYSYKNNKIYFSDLLPNSYKTIFPSEILNDKGIYNNSNVITYKINDEKVGNNKELKIKFTFLNQLDVNANDIEIYKYGSQVYTQMLGLTCENSGSDTICEFNLKYNVYDSIDDKLFFDFKFNNSYNVKVEDSIDDSGVYSNHKNVEFEIKNINLKEKSGVLFYLRNYDLYDYLKDYYSDEELGFSFYSAHPSNMLINKVIYPHDIRYKNTYFYLDNNDNYNVYVDSMNKLNNFDYFSVNFIYDKDLLLDNKYSSFYISNPNYLGSGDTDNQDLYITFNSSLFNYSVSKVVYNNGSGTFVKGDSFDDNIDFIINGSQENVESNPDNWIKTEFDEEIKAQYKKGLEYFKDKIIDMFSFVSELYNTMPEKFQVAFSLIFVLLIGIALFRLLL